MCTSLDQQRVLAGYRKIYRMNGLSWVSRTLLGLWIRELYAKEVTMG